MQDTKLEQKNQEAKNQEFNLIEQYEKNQNFNPINKYLHGLRYQNIVKVVSGLAKNREEPIKILEIGSGKGFDWRWLAQTIRQNFSINSIKKFPFNILPAAFATSVFIIATPRKQN
jgi:predicted O-methyltransferase YrrM